MPLPPQPPPAAQRLVNPARVMLDSPLAAATRSRVYRARRQPTRDKWRPLLAGLGSVFFHVLCLLCFVLGSAYQPDHRPESKQKYMQIRLIDSPEPPPPPPPMIVLGAPPKHHGPRHQGHASQPAAASERAASTTTKATAAAPAPALAQAKPAPAARPEPPASPPQPVSVPQPAPLPKLEVKPLQLAGEPLTISLPTPPVQAPAPPKFQPQAVRPPQTEGNRPLLTPTSLVMQELPPAAPLAISVPPLTMQIEPPKTVAPPSAQPTPLPPTSTPPVPAAPTQSLPAQASPAINLRAQWDVARPSVPLQRPQLQSNQIKLSSVAPMPETAPPAPAIVTASKAAAPAVKIDLDTKAFEPAVQPSIQIAPPAVAEQPAPAPATSVSKPAESPAPPSTPAPDSTSKPNQAGTQVDVSTAPEATPHGSDFANPGAPSGAPLPAVTSSQSAAATSASTLGHNKGSGPRQPGIGDHGGNQPGAAEGPKQGGVAGYIQLKPTGDVDIMHHAAPNLGYQSTRFDKDWTPEGESSIDTALRRAVDKTTVKHTFHLPRGVRVQCRIMPLLPMSLLGCTNPDPPAKPVAEKEYDRLHMAPANPVAVPAHAASSRPAAAPMAPADDSAECIAARISGGPPPPGCGAAKTFEPPRATPSSSGSSWVPASDQFH